MKILLLLLSWIFSLPSMAEESGLKVIYYDSGLSLAPFSDSQKKSIGLDLKIHWDRYLREAPEEDQPIWSLENSGSVTWVDQVPQGRDLGFPILNNVVEVLEDNVFPADCSFREEFYRDGRHGQSGNSDAMGLQAKLALVFQLGPGARQKNGDFQVILGSCQ